MSEIKSKKSFFSEWLEKLQQESWQLELLISGLALFGIWEFQYVLERFDHYIQVESIGSIRNYLRFFLLTLKAGWLIFLINLLFHIIIRGFWIGAIGLRYVSGGIDYESLNYSDRFTNFYKRTIGDFDDYIERLEKLSSVIFSYTFLLFFLLLSFIFFNGVFATVISFFNKFLDINESDKSGLFGVVGMIYYGLGFIVLIDFLTLGAFKKIKEPTVSRIYFYIYRFYSIVSISFISRPLLLNFIDNKYTRRLFFLAIPYGLIILVGFNGFRYDRYPSFPSFSQKNDHRNVIAQHSINWNLYDDLRSEHHLTYARNVDKPPKTKIKRASLNAHEHLQNSDAKLFLEYTEDMEDDILEKDSTLTPFRKKDFRYAFISDEVVADSTENLITSAKVRELRIMREAVRQSKKRTYSDDDAIQLYDTYSAYSRDDLSKLSDEIENRYEQKIKEYISLKLERMVNVIKGLHDVRIDDKNWNDQLDCSFYIHPNMHERGILCYIPLDSLKRGKHLIDIIKKPCRDCTEISTKIPFRIVSN